MSMMTIADFQSVFGGLLGTDGTVAGILIFAGVTVVIMAVSKSVQATMVVLIPVTIACMALGIIGSGLAMIMLICIVALLALSVSKIPGGH